MYYKEEFDSWERNPLKDQSTICKHCGRKGTIKRRRFRDGLQKGHVPYEINDECNDCIVGEKAVETYGSCDEWIFLFEGKKVMDLAQKFRACKNSHAHIEKENIDKARKAFFREREERIGNKF